MSPCTMPMPDLTSMGCTCKQTVDGYSTTQVPGRWSECCYLASPSHRDSMACAAGEAHSEFVAVDGLAAHAAAMGEVPALQHEPAARRSQQL